MIRLCVVRNVNYETGEMELVDLADGYSIYNANAYSNMFIPQPGSIVFVGFSENKKALVLGMHIDVETLNEVKRQFLPFNSRLIPINNENYILLFDGGLEIKVDTIKHFYDSDTSTVSYELKDYQIFGEKYRVLFESSKSSIKLILSPQNNPEDIREISLDNEGIRFIHKTLLGESEVVLNSKGIFIKTGQQELNVYYSGKIEAKIQGGISLTMDGSGIVLKSGASEIKMDRLGEVSVKAPRGFKVEAPFVVLPPQITNSVTNTAFTLPSRNLGMDALDGWLTGLLTWLSAHVHATSSGPTAPPVTPPPPKP